MSNDLSAWNLLSAYEMARGFTHSTSIDVAWIYKSLLDVIETQKSLESKRKNFKKIWQSKYIPDQDISVCDFVEVYQASLQTADEMIFSLGSITVWSKSKVCHPTPFFQSLNGGCFGGYPYGLSHWFF